MAWNNDDWVWVQDSPSGGVYQNKYNPQLYSNAQGVVGTLQDVLGGGGGNTYTTKLDADGSVTGVPGATYQIGSNGSVSIISRPSSGGGGSTSPTNVYINQNPGELYQTIVSDGSDGYPAGTVYQVNQLTGAVTVKSRPSSSAGVNPADKNGDGLDDTTNMALGVYPYKGSPTGYAYGNGQPVWPNGAPYEGETGNAPPTLVNGKYIWDGTKFVVAPGMETPTSSSSGSSGSSTVRVTGISGSSGGSSGGGSSSQYDTAGYRQMTQAVLEREAALAALKGPDTVSAEGSANRAFQAEQNAMDRAQRAQETAAAQRSKDIESFRAAVNDTDPNAVRAWLYGNGIGAGGNIVNRMGEGTDALSPNALAGAAALLGGLRGTPAAALGSWMQDYPGLANVAASGGTGAVSGGVSGDSGTAGVGAGGGLATPATPQAPALLGNWRLMRNPLSGEPTVWQNFDTGAVMPWMPGETNAPTDFAGVPEGPNNTGLFRSGNWVRLEVGGQPVGWVNALDRTRREYDPNDPNGVKLAYNDRMDGVGMTTPGQKLYNNLYYDAQGGQHVMGTGNAQYQLVDGKLVQVGGSEDTQLPVGIQSPQMADIATKGGIPTPWSPGTFDATGTWIPSGQPQPTNNITTPGNGAAPAGVIDYGNDNIQRGIELPNKTVVPGLARGGVAYGPMIVGDSPSGRPTGHEEMVIAPQGARVIPLRGMAPSQRRVLMRGLRRYALGTDPWAWQGVDWNQSDNVDAGGNAYSDFSAFSPANAQANPLIAQLGGMTPAYNAPAPTAAPAYSAPPPTPTVPALPATTAGSSTATPVATATPSTPSTGSPSSSVASPSPAPASGSTATQPATQTTTPAATQPAAQPVTVQSLSGTYDVSNLTPDQQSLMDEIANWRRNATQVDLNGLSPYSVEFAGLNPYVQDAYYKGIQTKYGVPAGALQWEVARNQAMMPGLSRGAASVGY